MKILIVRLSALGDVTYTLPALVALRRAHPTAHIAWLVEAMARGVVEGHAALDRLLVWDRRRFTGLLRSGRWLAAAGVLTRFVRDVRDTRYDLVIDFQGLLKSGIWVGLARGQRKAGFGKGLDHGEGGQILLNQRVPLASMDVPALERNLILLDALGVPRGPVVHDFPVTDAARQHVEGLLTGLGLAANETRVAIHPMTRWPTKLWDNARFAAVADTLSAQGVRVVFTGAPGDKPAINDILGRARHRAWRLDGQLDLKGLAALFERCRAVVCTDTGPMHIAAAAGTPVVALFGPTSPVRTGPYGPQHVVVRAGVACSPCFSRRCHASVAEPMACMERLAVADVVNAVLEILRRQPVV